MKESACTGCPLEKQSKNTQICSFCLRRIQAVEGKPITAPYPTQADVEKACQILRSCYDMDKDPLVTGSKSSVCESCGGELSCYSASNLCRRCYLRSGEVCRTETCENKLSPHNKSGFCRDCGRIIHERKKLGLDPYAPVKKRKRVKGYE